MHNIAKGGFRKDLKQYFRSKTESNIARYYTYMRIPWVYEIRTFKFYNIKRGTRYYTPDFYLPKLKLFIEVKGSWFSPSDKTKLRRFKRYYSEDFQKLRFIIPDKYSRSKANGEMIKFLCDDLGVDFELILSYKEMEKYGKLIPGWE